MCTIGNIVISENTDRHVIEQPFSTTKDPHTTDGDRDSKCWCSWRMKKAFTGQRDGSYSCLSHVHTPSKN